MLPRKWTLDQLRDAAERSRSIRQMLGILGLRQAGANYGQIRRLLTVNAISTEHFTGRSWNKGLRGLARRRIPLEEILVRSNACQSHKLKLRLFAAGLKQRRFELCGWAEQAPDGRVPVELDHINGDRLDNRLDNLRVLCPNCHSLQPTHRALNSRQKVG